MNKLEAKLLNSAVAAQANHMRMTDGWWLWHGPESFLQHEIARSIVRTGHTVFTEASPKKIAAEHGRPMRGRPLKSNRRRFDIVVWQKTRNRLRAIVEIKRTFLVQSAIEDGKKIQTYLRTKYSYGVGYFFCFIRK